MTTVSVVTADGIKTAITPVKAVGVNNSKPVTVSNSKAVTVSAPTKISIATTIKPTTVSSSNATTVIAPMHPTVADDVRIYSSDEPVMEGKEDILITILKTATREQLDDYKKQMKEKDIELSFDEIEYDNNGTLVRLSGTMKSKDGTSNFVASSFSKLILSVVRNGEHSYFKVRTTSNKVTL
jgi:hypothetical protein